MTPAGTNLLHVDVDGARYVLDLERPCGCFLVNGKWKAWRGELGGNNVEEGVGHSTDSDFTCLTCKANVVVRELVDCILRGYRSE